MHFQKVGIILLSMASGIVTAQQSVPVNGSAFAPLLQSYVERKQLAGAVTAVASRDKVLSLEAVGYSDIAANKPMQTDSLFWIASMSKPITATAVMMLVDEGKIRLDDPVGKYLPHFAPQITRVTPDGAHVHLQKPSQPITVRMLLSHTSGLVAVSPIETPTLDLLPPAIREEGYALSTLEFEPGSEFMYSIAGINTAARIVEVVSGIAFEEFLQKRLFDPLDFGHGGNNKMRELGEYNSVRCKKE